jgi:hypothetical protein
VTLPLYPNNELVGTAFLKSIVGDRVATTLPKDNTTWTASGFCTVDTVGGSPNIYVPLDEPVLGVECWAVNPDSQKPPWNKAAALASLIKHTCWDHPNLPRNLVLPGGYPMVQVRSAYLTGEPRRVPDDPSSYARYSIPGLVVVWTVMQP